MLLPFLQVWKIQSLLYNQIDCLAMNFMYTLITLIDNYDNDKQRF